MWQYLKKKFIGILVEGVSGGSLKLRNPHSLRLPCTLRDDVDMLVWFVAPESETWCLVVGELGAACTGPLLLKVKVPHKPSPKKQPSLGTCTNTGP